jgi:hypothetical protein
MHRRASPSAGGLRSTIRSGRSAERADTCKVRFSSEVTRLGRPAKSWRRTQRVDHVEPDEPPLDVAFTSPDVSEWMSDCRNSKCISLVPKGVFSLVERPLRIPVIKGKWVLKLKRDEHGETERYKARYVAKDFAQQHHVH